MEELMQWGVFGLFIATFLASTVIPSAGTPILIFLLAKGADPIVCISVATIGNWVGAVLIYYLGYQCRWDILEKYFKIKQDKLEKANGLVNKYKEWASLLTGVPLIGDRISLVLGIARCHYKSALSYMFVGKLIRYIVLVSLIYSGTLAFN
jgi:membrane protein YqaA with SNARE-associated domain